MLNDQKQIRLMFVLMTGIFSSAFCNSLWAATISCTDAGFVPCTGANSNSCQTTCAITTANKNQDANGSYFFDYECPTGYSTGTNRIFSGTNISASAVIPSNMNQVFTLQNQGYYCAYNSNNLQGWTGTGSAFTVEFGYQYFTNLYYDVNSVNAEGPVFMYVAQVLPYYPTICCPGGTFHAQDGSCIGVACYVGPASGACGGCPLGSTAAQSTIATNYDIWGYQPYCAPLNSFATAPLQNVCIYTGPGWTASPTQTTNNGCVSTQGTNETPDATSVCPPVLTPMLPGPGTTTAPGF